jgi:hypothetical protein
MPLAGLGATLMPDRPGSLGADGRIDIPLDPGSAGALPGLEGRRGASPGAVTGAKLTPLRRASSRNNDSPAASAAGGAVVRPLAGGGMAGEVVRAECSGGTLDCRAGLSKAVLLGANSGGAISGGGGRRVLS